MCLLPLSILIDYKGVGLFLGCFCLFVTGCRLRGLTASLREVWLGGDGRQGGGRWELFCISTVSSFISICKIAILHINSRLARAVGVSGRQLPWLQAPAQEFGDGLLCATGPRLPGLRRAAKKGRKYWTASRCSWLWEESEMRLWRRVQAGI